MHRVTLWTWALLALPALPAGGQTLAPMRITDLTGRIHQLFDASNRATVIVFMGLECPISNRYIPALNDLAKREGVAFFGVISDPILKRQQVIRWRDEYNVGYPIVFDASCSLARQLKPAVTPEAFVLDREGQVVYRGRIDDGFSELGGASPIIKSHDLADAITAVLENKPITTPKTTAIGCLFEAAESKAAPAGVTYARDIAPILNANCVSCHRAGEIAPFPLDTYTDAAKRARQIAAVTESRYMPPWKPKAGFGQFVGEHRLSDGQIELLSGWADSGAPQGDPTELPPAPKFPSGWTNGEPDLVVTMPEAFTVPAGGRDLYRAFVVPLDLLQDVYVAGIEFRPGAKSVVHHCLLFLDTTGAARRLDEAEDGPGYTSFGGPGFAPTGGLGGWAPGVMPALLPEGVGRLVRGGSDLVFQMHYHPDGRPRSDRSSVAIYLQKKPVRRVVSGLALGTRDIDIPAGEPNYTRTAQLTLPVDVTLTAITPHMHLVGREMKVHATAPDGRQIPLIWIDDWDFKWQGQYRFAAPITLPKGTIIELAARYDNSAGNPNNPNDPPRRVRRGEQTTDEMCLCFLEFQADSQRQAQLVRRAVMGEMIGGALRRGFGRGDTNP